MEQQRGEKEEVENETASAISVESSIHSTNASKYDEKLRFYAEECKRYSIEKLRIIRRLIEEVHSDCNLQNFIIGALQCRVMFEAFRMLPTTRLTVVNLKDNHLDLACCHSMASFIDQSDTLKNLCLEGCQICASDDRGVEILSHVLDISISITHLNLSRNQIKDSGGETLVAFLKRNHSCIDLNLSRNQLGMRTAKALESALSENRTLKRLDLSHNLLHERQAGVEIMKGVARNETLEHLDLSWNGLGGSDFGKTLSKYVKKSTLKIFKLEYNRLTTFDFRKLALGIKYSEAIEEVHVGGNFFTPGDDVILMRVFRTDTPLQLLSFGTSFHLSDDAYGLLKDSRAIKPSIRAIYQNICLPNPPRDVSMLDIYADRAKFLAMKPKQRRLRRDMGVFMIKLQSLQSQYMVMADFTKILNAFNAKLDAELIEQYVEACLASNERTLIVDVHKMASHYLSRHPRQRQQQKQQPPPSKNATQE